MRRTFLLVAFLALLVAGCGDDNSASTDSDQGEEAIVEETTTTPVSEECLNAATDAVEEAEASGTFEGNRLALPDMTSIADSCDSLEAFVVATDGAGAAGEGVRPTSLLRVACSRDPSLQACPSNFAPGQGQARDVGTTGLCDSHDYVVAALQLGFDFQGENSPSIDFDRFVRNVRGAQDDEFLALRTSANVLDSALDVVAARTDPEMYAEASDALYRACVRAGWSRLWPITHDDP